VEGDEIVFTTYKKGESPKGTMGKVVKGMDQNTKAARESAQSVKPENLKRAIEFVRGQSSFLEKSGISVSKELDTLNITNVKFQHISMEIGASAHRVFGETKNVEKLIKYMLLKKKKEKATRQLFGLTFKRLLAMM